MKKTYLIIAVFMAAFAGSLSVQAQTDVTATYLANAGFDNSCNYLVSTAASNLATGTTNNQAVTGWTLTASIANTASSTFEYGYAGTLNLSGTLYGFIPAQGPDAATGTGHGALGITSAWASPVTYYQTVTLPAGKYAIQYAAYNSGPTAVNYSRVGWVPTAGTSVISAKTSFAMASWTTETIKIAVADATTGNIQVGISSPNSGSGTVGRIFFDYVKLISLDLKADLIHLKDSANVMYSNQQAVGTSTAYTDLNTAMTNAQVVIDNAGATVQNVIDQETAIKAAIAKVYSAILINQRAIAWTTLPYNITSLITNPSFETNSTTGWTNVGAMAMQSNTSFAFKAGTYYVEKWKSTGNWTGLKLSQKIVDIPNGVYSLTAAGLNNPITTGGAFVYANAVKAEVFATNDYSVTVTVTNNEIEIGYEVTNGGNYVAVDNFRLSYVSDGSPYVILAPSALFFDPINLTKTFNVSGGNLTSGLTLVAPAGISLDKTSLTAVEVNAGTVVTATFDNATTITNGTITATTGTVVQNVSVNTSADLSCFTPLYTTLTNLIPNPYLNDLSPYAGWGHKSVVFGGAYCGAACVKFDAVTNSWPDGAALDVNGIPWAANSTYRLHAWVKAVDGTFAFFAKGTSPDVTISVPMTGDVWTEINTTFTTGASPTANFFTFNNVDGASTGKIAYIDNYELYNITSLLTAVNTLSNKQVQNVYIQNNHIVADINLEASAKVEFSVFNAQGMLLSNTSSTLVSGNNHQVINANLPSGLYFVRIAINGKSATTKVIK